MSFWSDLGSLKIGAAFSDLDPFKRGNIFGSPRNQPGIPAPPKPFDLTDQLLKYAQQAELVRQKTGNTRQSTFGAGPGGLLGSPGMMPGGLVGPRLGGIGGMGGIGGGF